ncbi:hypothetical protein LY625_09195 [Lysobacter sp. GX 14042]|uniref:hypothetical protein n=1 Tax=Lysobacter sp. GX 14042 TaxID=2907155 RepID=UPI001F17AA67|nr:hypothetical protein [Lysobacter sp. GX 14042]MCE7032783.1 hypothetical protein [Lysobacter sp. GX 14042]
MIKISENVPALHHQESRRYSRVAAVSLPSLPTALAEAFEELVDVPVAREALIVLGSAGEALQFLKKDNDAQLLVFVPHPVRRLAAALEEGVLPSAAIERSATEMRVVIELLRTGRRRAVLVEQSDFLARPAAIWSALDDAPGHANKDPDHCSTYLSREEGSNLYDALALLCMIESAELGSLLGEVEASFVPSRSMRAPPAVWESAFVELARLKEAAVQRDLAQEQYAELQSEFEVVARAEAALAKRVLVLLREVSTIEAERNRLVEDLQQLRAAHERDHGQLMNLTSKAEYLRGRKIAAERHALALEQQLVLMQKSSSWRITSPLRALKTLMGGLR